MSARICKIEGCPKLVKESGWCSMHSTRYRRHGDPHVLLKGPRGECSEPDCGRPHYAHGLCAMHYQRTKYDERKRAANARRRLRYRMERKNGLRPRSLDECLARQASRTRFLKAVKLTCGCIDCGYREETGRLHFDHRPGTIKEFNPGSVSTKAWRRIIDEIEKCDVRCNSCHARRHSPEFRRERDQRTGRFERLPA